MSQVKYLVLDEADRMLEMNFEKELTQIVNQTSSERQTGLFSATWENDIQLLASEYLQKEAYYVQIGSSTTTLNTNIEQFFELVQDTPLKDRIAEIIVDNPSIKIMIFTNTKKEARNLAYELNDATDRQVNFITSDLDQDERSHVMAKFRNEKACVLVATDVASRGIDVKDIDVVINYGFPINRADFIHRIGRTGRAGNTGKALTFIFPRTSGVEKSLNYIQQLYKSEKVPVPSSLTAILKEVGS